MRTDPFDVAWFLQGSSIQAGRVVDRKQRRRVMLADMFIDLPRNIERAPEARHVDPATGAVGRGNTDGGGNLTSGHCADAFNLRLRAISRRAHRPDLCRAGRWNMVIGSSDLLAMNFGMDRLPPHDRRHDMAEEFVEICRKLWGAWDPGCIVADEDNHI